jgi:hypothetical protein
MIIPAGLQVLEAAGSTPPILAPTLPALTIPKVTKMQAVEPEPELRTGRVLEGSGLGWQLGDYSDTCSETEGEQSLHHGSLSEGERLSTVDLLHQLV